VGELQSKQEFAMTLMQGFKEYLEIEARGSGSGLALLKGRASAVEVANKVDKAEEMEEMEDTEGKKDKGKGKEKEKEDDGEGMEDPALPS
jgi:hypothetical protein